jgi:hypothetical protein
MPRKGPGADSKAKAEPSPLGDHIIERPDGFYWESKGGEPHGPFPTLPEAEADMLAGGAPAEGSGDVEEAGSLHEAESDLGINEWIDPDTGGPAEDNVPRIEDH